MSYEMFMIIQIVGIAFLGYIIGNGVGYAQGHRDASKAWKEVFGKEY